MADFGNLLRGFRERAGFSQSALAHAAGIDKSYASKLESGRREVTSRALALRLAAILELSASEIDLWLTSAGYISPRMQSMAAGGVCSGSSSGCDRGTTDPLPLSRQIRLAADAFAASRMVLLINRITGKHASAASTGPSVVSQGIDLAERLQQGDAYLEQSRTLHIPPETAGTVEYMRAHGTSDITARTEEIVPFLQRIESLIAEGLSSELNELEPQSLEHTREFFRLVHTSIADQLGLSESPDIPPDIG